VYSSQVRSNLIPPCQSDLNFAPRSSASPNEIYIQFDEPQKAVAPGQVAALWDGDGEWCLGCGVIDRATSVPEAPMRPSERCVEREKGKEQAAGEWEWW
jgi:tRNA-5-taurinomethyluridine 2-sulfurtransferase